MTKSFSVSLVKLLHAHYPDAHEIHVVPLAEGEYFVIFRYPDGKEHDLVEVAGDTSGGLLPIDSEQAPSRNGV